MEKERLLTKTTEKERILIATDRETLTSVLNELFILKHQTASLPDFEKDRISKPQAAKLAGITIPTLDKLVRAGKFKQYELGAHRYFLKSEVIEALRSNS